MTSVARTSRSLFLAAAGAVLAWVIVEPWPWLTTDQGPGQVAQMVDMNSTAVLGLITGICVGLGLGVAEGLNTGSASKFWRSVWLFAGIGGVGGMCGIYIGQIVYGSLAGAGALGAQLVARVLGWGLWGVGIGVGVGLALGILTGSSRRLSLSSIGGAIGGAVGGFVFEFVGFFTRFLGGGGEVLRLLGFTATAAGIGLLSSLAQELFKQAWIRVMVGRAEGREYFVDKPQTVVGRDELADVPLFGDPSILRRHLVIENVGGAFVAQAGEPGAAFAVNGQTVSTAPLTDGAIITVGSRQLEFRTKRAAVPGGQYQAQAPVAVDPAVCQYCGSLKDAFGGCQCSSFDTAPVPQPTGPFAQQPPTASQPTFAQDQTAVQQQQWQPQASGRVLEVISGPNAGARVPLSEGQELQVGREPGVGLQLADTFASRKHAMISLMNGVVDITDTGSSNGTLVNGARILRAALQPGDVVTIGQTQIRLT